MKRINKILLTAATPWLMVHTFGCNSPQELAVHESEDIASATVDVPPSYSATADVPPSYSAPTALPTSPVAPGAKAHDKHKDCGPKPVVAGGPVGGPKGEIHVEIGTGSKGGGGSFGTFKPIRTDEEDDDGGHHGFCGNRVLEGSEQCDDGNKFNDDACNNDCLLTNESCSFQDSRYGAYVYCTDSKTWQDAHAACLALGPFDLVTVNGADEDAFLTKLINGGDNYDDDDDDDGNTAWLGFNDIAVEDEFVWSSGDPSTYTNWWEGEPNNSGNEDCAQLYDNGYWNDAQCDNQYSFICEAIFSNPVDL